MTGTAGGKGMNYSTPARDRPIQSGVKIPNVVWAVSRKGVSRVGVEYVTTLAKKANNRDERLVLRRHRVGEGHNFTLEPCSVLWNHKLL